MKSKIIIICFLFVLFCFFGQEAIAQCPMCRMAAESNLDHGGTMGKGLNKGILYLFMMPYLLVFTLGFIWYRNKRIVIDDDSKDT